MRRRPAAVAAVLSIVTTAGAAPLQPGHPDVDPSRLPRGTVQYASARIAGGDSTALNTTLQAIGPVQWNGEDALRIDTVHASAEGDTTRGTIVVRAKDLSLLHHRVRAARDSMSVSCSGPYVTGWVVLPDQPVRLIDLRLEGAVFPVDGPAPWLVSALPLAEGYTADIARFDPWSGKVREFPVVVLGEETVDLDGDAVACWKVDTGPMGPPGYRGIRWVDRNTGMVVRTLLKGPEDRPRYSSWAASIEPSTAGH